MESLVQKYKFLALVEKCVVGINDGAEKKININFSKPKTQFLLKFTFQQQ